MTSSLDFRIEPLGFPWKTQDPFLFCAHHRDLYPAGNSALGPDSEELRGRNIGSDFTIKDGWRMYHGKAMPGFPYHPHRGFETITINKEGVVDHSDSLGAAGRFMAGDVQWMTAGSGVQHSEMFPMVHQDQDNTLEIFQVWLNLPAKSKMVDPHFKMLWSETIPRIEESDTEGLKTYIDLIAGSMLGHTAPAPTPDSWAANTAHGVAVFTVHIEAGAVWTLDAHQADASRTLFYYRGDTLSIDNRKIRADHRIIAPAGEAITLVNGSQDSYLLVLEGKPIGEPVVQHGPFVMNTQDEIRETMKEYGRTQFGGWPWPETEMSHGPDKGRFALHADGREEIPTTEAE